MYLYSIRPVFAVSLPTFNTSGGTGVPGHSKMFAKITKTNAKMKDFAKGSAKITKNARRLPKLLISTVFFSKCARLVGFI